MINGYTQLRKQVYEDSLRGAFVKSIQEIHDRVRIGEIKRLQSPITVFWEITSRCNLTCKHCYADPYVIRNKENIDEIDLTQAYHIIDELAAQQVWEVVLQGGEPLCYSYINQVISYIKQKGLSVTILTNGTRLTDEIYYTIKQGFEKTDLIQISLDGYGSWNDYIRGKGVYKTVIQNLKHLDIKNIVINVVVTKENLYSLQQMCDDIMTQTHVRSIHFSPVMQTGKGKSFQSPTPRESISVFLRLKEIYNEIMFSGTMFPDTVFLKEGNPYHIDLRKTRLGCCAGRSKLFIDYQGRVYSCDFRRNDEYMSIFQNSLSQIWNKLWSEQIEKSYVTSQQMHKDNIFLAYCPNMKDGETYEPI